MIESRRCTSTVFLLSSLLLFSALFLIAPQGDVSVFANESQKPTDPRIVHCQTVQEVTEARRNGAIFIETAGRYFVRIDGDYRGPFANFDTARTLREEYEEAVRQRGGIVETGPTGSGEVVANPELMLFPFVELSAEKGVLFTLPSGEVAPASRVMIHPEPFSLEQVSFGRIHLDPRSIQRGQRSLWGSDAEIATIDADSEPRDFFAVTGSVRPKNGIEFDLKEHNAWVGAAVVGQDGVVLWRNYGEVDERLTFSNMRPMQANRISPQFLLIFLISEGALDKNLRPNPNFPELDASPYDYHVLCSAALEVAPNWFPPVDEAIQAEYEKLMREAQQRRGAPFGN